MGDDDNSGIGCAVLIAFFIGFEYLIDSCGCNPIRNQKPAYESQSLQTPAVKKPYFLDVNEDGIKDMAIKTHSGNYEVYLGKNDGTFNSVEPINTEMTPKLDQIIKEQIKQMNQQIPAEAPE